MEVAPPLLTLGVLRTRKTTADIAAALLSLYEQSGGALDLGLSAEEMAGFKLAASSAAPLEVLYRQGLTGRVAREALDAMNARTRAAMRTMAPEIGRMLAEKAALGKACPYDRETLMFLAKAVGIVTARAPMSTDEARQQEQEDAEIATMSTTDLRKVVLGQVAKEPPKDEENAA